MIYKFLEIKTHVFQFGLRMKVVFVYTKVNEEHKKNSSTTE